MNILLLTSVYPSPTDKGGNVTKVVQFFAKEWQSMGHNVLVIHNTSRYPAVVHMLPLGVREKLTKKLNFLIPDLKKVQQTSFMDEGVKVYKIPILKVKPHSSHPQFVIKRQADRIDDLMKTEKFSPDIIMGHWLNPQIQLISELKKRYPCRTSLVLHGDASTKDFAKICSKYLPYIDKLGCRSKSEAQLVQRKLNLNYEPFICYSGVPDKFVNQYPFNDNKYTEVPKYWKFIYVGRLVAYKHIDQVLFALSRLNNQNYTFDIVGSGNEEKNLVDLAQQLGISDKVIFHGQVSRTEVLQLMQSSDAFIMVSKGEVFGLVYLEAMTSTCLAIGSRGEGIDGIINDGQNGFLVEPADAEALKNCLDYIMKELRFEDYKQILKSGYDTACRFRDSNVAAWYLDDVCNIK